MRRSRAMLTVGLLGLTAPLRAQVPEVAVQIQEALLAAPEPLREGATVLGTGGEPRDGDVLTMLRQGSNGIICLADAPDREGFHVACYQEALDPFMRLGRTLRAEGMERSAIMAERYEALERGEFSMPPAAALYSLTADERPGPGDGDRGEVRRLSVVYLPHATAEGTGLSARPSGAYPWLMLAGTPWAHVMISH